MVKAFKLVSTQEDIEKVIESVSSVRTKSKIGLFDQSNDEEMNVFSLILTNRTLAVS